VWAPNLPEWVILEYAAGLAGLVLVTVNPAFRAAELAYVLNQSGAAGIFLVPEVRSPMAAFLKEVRPDVPSLREVVLFTDWGDFLGTAPRRRSCPTWRRTTSRRSSTPPVPPASPRVQNCVIAA
jgi:fatty-acyl-CoA synthase